MRRSEADRRIRELCERRGMRFKPWEVPPWRVHSGPSPWPANTAGAASWKPAQRLRQRLLEEIEQELAAIEKPARRERG
jgi:hypothetical protein